MTNPESWLHTMTVSISIMMGFLLLASLPVPETLRSRFQLHQSAMKGKRIVFTTIAFALVSWFLAWIAPHIMDSPVWCVNTVAMSQLLFAITMVLFVVVLGVRIVQRNNAFMLMFLIVIRYIPFLITILGYMFTWIAMLFIHSLETNSQKLNSEDDDSLSDIEKASLDHGINLNGDYCDKKKTNWYF
jgi:hypothetical protein